MNKVTIMGRLGKDPETRNFQNGGKVVNLRVATSERYKDKEGNKQERVEWVSVAIFNEHLADVAERYLHKGDQVLLMGKLETRKWQGQDGKDNYSTEVVLRQFNAELHLLNNKRDDDDRSDDRGSQQRDQPAQRGARGDEAAKRGGASGGQRGGWDQPKQSDLDDDIPF